MILMVFQKQKNGGIKVLMVFQKQKSRVIKWENSRARLLRLEPDCHH